MRIFITEAHSGNSFAVDVELKTNVFDLKSRIQDATGISPSCQVVAFHGVPLKNFSTMESNGLQDGAFLDLTAHLRGGCTFEKTCGGCKVEGGGCTLL